MASHVMGCQVMGCIALRCDTMRYDAIRCDTMRYDAIRCDTIRYDTMRPGVLSCAVLSRVCLYVWCCCLLLCVCVCVLGVTVRCCLRMMVSCMPPCLDSSSASTNSSVYDRYNIGRKQHSSREEGRGGEQQDRGAPRAWHLMGCAHEPRRIMFVPYVMSCHVMSHVDVQVYG